MGCQDEVGESVVVWGGVGVSCTIRPRPSLTPPQHQHQHHHDTTHQRLGGPAFHAVSEENGGGTTLLSCRVVADDIYQRQVNSGLLLFVASSFLQ